MRSAGRVWLVFLLMPLLVCELLKTVGESTGYGHVSCEQDLGKEGQRDLQEIIPGILIDGRFRSSTLDGKGSTPSEGSGLSRT
jgi:hypothetical protein